MNFSKTNNTIEVFRGYFVKPHPLIIYKSVSINIKLKFISNTIFSPKNTYTFSILTLFSLRLTPNLHLLLHSLFLPF